MPRHKKIIRVPTEFWDEYRPNNYKYVTSGIYFLYNEKKTLIYVGKSIDVFNRLVQSAHAKKGSIYFKVITCPERDLDALEQYYIAKLRPTRNKTYKRKKAEAPCFEIALNEEAFESDIYELEIFSR